MHCRNGARLHMLPALVVCVDAVGDALSRRTVVGLLHAYAQARVRFLHSQCSTNLH